MSTRHDWLGPPAERGSFRPTPLIFEHVSQVVEADDHIGMIGAEAFLVDFERTAIKRLGLGKPVRVLKQHRQIVEAVATCG